MNEPYIYVSSKCCVESKYDFWSYKEAIARAMLDVERSDARPVKITHGRLTLWTRSALIGRYYLSTNSLGCYSPQYIASFK